MSSANLYWSVYCSIDERPVGVHGSSKVVEFDSVITALLYANNLNENTERKPGEPDHYQVRTHSHQIKTAHRRHGGAS